MKHTNAYTNAHTHPLDDWKKGRTSGLYTLMNVLTNIDNVIPHMSSLKTGSGIIKYMQ